MFAPISDRQAAIHPVRIAPTVLIDLMRAQRYGVEYQPIVELRSGEIVAYEALARFYAADGQALAPKPVFDALHHSPLSLYQVEFDMKRLQLEHAPADEALFVNLDPDAYAVTADEPEEPLLNLLRQRAGLVVEIIENSDVSDAHLSQRLAHSFAAHGIRLALDDIGAPNSMISLEVMMEVDWFKFDRSWLARARDSKSRAALVHLIAFAQECGCRVILEGIERQEDLELAQALGVDCVQGFLYRKQFRSVAKARCAW
ncbi:EAL domain-containing protein [Chitinimonas taiwanensis]|uniref:EAL domain, c-di-GMP-specific phosphodiesterase class I (Or its enzymatically inactive variant) n=1 Tax=Chitinimonas taiwanensis DSM 18899 TaxID=1121279 RepID=A0A1K2H419_9NEIS|nr:EAL domain-containing protein [Chitinimonas taiwanensis]SFZ70461.1 EAL domain, c-di-GMP-specific phosphodiesterase class I (or its enzymatically inactive variant) [Chitinimonas taiwanensis DSM 18899]